MTGRSRSTMINRTITINTIEQKTREFSHWKIVEAERAKERQKAAGSNGAPHGVKGGRGNKRVKNQEIKNKPLQANLPEGVLNNHANQSSAKAAERVGMTRRSRIKPCYITGCQGCQGCYGHNAHKNLSTTT